MVHFILEVLWYIYVIFPKLNSTWEGSNHEFMWDDNTLQVMNICIFMEKIFCEMESLSHQHLVVGGGVENLSIWLFLSGYASSTDVHGLWLVDILHTSFQIQIQIQIIVSTATYLRGRAILTEWNSTHCGPVTPYVDQHWLRYWLVAWWHQAITWTDVDLSSVGLWHSYWSYFTKNVQNIYPWYEFENFQWLNEGLTSCDTIVTQSRADSRLASSHER